jgi:hypothetical protein
MAMVAMMRPSYLKILSCLVVVIVPAALFAADPPAAMLYSHGTALINGSIISRSTALFSGDLVQTNSDSVANINATGSSVLILNDSLVQYQGSSLNLEHGGVTISTSKLLATRAGGVTVSPVSAAWTEFEVRDVDGKVQIAAHKGDLAIHDDKGTTTLAQGEQTTRDDDQSPDEKKKRNRRAPAAAIPAWEDSLDSPWAVGIGAGIMVGGTVWVLAHSDDPLSPAKP